MKIKIKPGDKIKVTFPKKFPDLVDIYIVDNVDVKDHSFGTIRLEKVSRKETMYGTTSITKYDDNPVPKAYSVVEELWFDFKETGRKVEIIK